MATWSAGGPSRYTTLCAGATDDYPIIGRLFVMRHVGASSAGREFALTPGPITLTRVPLGRDVTYSAQRHGRFRFRLANGDTGTLVLAPRREDIHYVLDPSSTRGAANLRRTRAECPFLSNTVLQTRTVWIWAGPTGEEEEVIVCSGFEPRHREDGAIAIFSVGAGSEGRAFSLRGTGAIFFTSAPEGRDMPRRAIHNAVLRFRTADGRRGLLRLAPNPEDSRITLVN